MQSMSATESIRMHWSKCEGSSVTGRPGEDITPAQSRQDVLARWLEVLQLAQRSRNRPNRGTNRRRHAADKSHEQRKPPANSQQHRRYSKRKRNMRKCLKIHRARREAIERQHG